MASTRRRTISAGIISLVTRSIPDWTPPTSTAAVVPRTTSVSPMLSGPLAVNAPKNAPTASASPVSAPVPANQM